jgi:hypothetical protein
MYANNNILEEHAFIFRVIRCREKGIDGDNMLL